MSDTQKIRIGVVGAGWFASRRHLPDIAASAEAEVVALCRRDEAQLRRVADHFGVRRTFTDYRRMLDEVEIDALLVATPHALHHAHARAALERGLHVLLEKPMTVSSADARDLVALSQERRRVLVVAHNPPYWPHGHLLRRTIRSEAFGDLESASMSWVGNAAPVFGKAPMPEDMPGVVPPTLYRGDPALSGGGIFIDGGTHLVCELLWATGLRARSVVAVMDDPILDMRATVTIALENGALATICYVGDSRCPTRRIRNTYFGSRATLLVEGQPFSLTTIRPGEPPTTVVEKDMPKVPSPVGNFIDAVKGRADPLSGPLDGLRCVEVVEAAYRSARSGQQVVIG
jgi:predicted dehydrogenase